MTTQTAPATNGSSNGEAPLLEVKNLKMYFPVTSGIIFQRKIADVKAVDDVTFTINQGETLGLVGESGCGKTTTGRAILQLYKPTDGDVMFEGTRLNDLDSGSMRAMRRKMQIIFQDPYGSLNPRMTCGDIVGEPLIVHKLTSSKGEYRERVAELLQVVGLNPYMADRYPHEFSGGQRQRIGIARALAVNPSFIVCDEPVSALDVSIQAQVINLLEDLQEQFGLTYLFIAHDLSVVRHISDRVAVMYLGPHSGDRGSQRALREPAASVHAGVAVGGADSGPASGSAARAHHPDGGRAKPDESARRLRIPHALPGGGGRLPARDAGVARGVAGALGIVHPR